MFIFLDDERNPSDVTWVRYPCTNDVWTVVRSFEEFRTLVETLERPPMLISFDHDLGLGKDGKDCARIVASMAFHKWKELPEYVVHSKNPVGKERIEGFLEGVRSHVDSRKD